MKATSVTFLSSKMFVTLLSLASMLREFPLSSDLQWIVLGLSPVLHSQSVASWTMVFLEASLVVGLWFRANRTLMYGVAFCVAGVGLITACIFAGLSYYSPCSLLPHFRPEIVLGEKILFTAAVVVSLRGNYSKHVVEK